MQACVKSWLLQRIGVVTGLLRFGNKSYNFLKPSWDFDTCTEYVVKAQTSLAPLSRFRGSRVTTAHAHQIHQCCIFQSYAKTVPSQMKLTMKLTMREPTFMGSMTTDHVIMACDVWLLQRIGVVYWFVKVCEQSYNFLKPLWDFDNLYRRSTSIRHFEQCNQ